MKETIQTLFREIDSAREKKLMNRRNSEKKNKVELSEVVNQSDHALLKRQRTYDLQQGSAEDPRIEAEREKALKKLPYSSSSFMSKKEPTKLQRYEDEGSKKLLMGPKKGIINSSKMTKAADSSKKLIEKDAPISLKSKIGVTGPQGLGLSALGLKRNNSPKVKTTGNPLSINTRMGKAPAPALTPKDKTSNQTPSSLQQNLSTAASSNSNSNVKRIISQLKSSTSNKTKFNLNFKDLTSKPKGLDPKGELAYKLSFKTSHN